MKQGKKEQDSVYIGIEDPIAVRRQVLEASKSMVRMLKGQHGLRELRATKHRMIEELRGKIGSINELIAEAKRLMPQTTLLAPERKPEGKKATATPRQAKEKASETPRGEGHMDKFERELQDIERKLQSL